MKYLRHINESDLSDLTTTFKNLIRWNIVDDAKDMSLEYLDENANNVLFIEIKYETFNRYMRNNLETLDIYACNYRYKNLKEDWNNIEDDGHSLYKEKIDANKIEYYFYIYEVIENAYQDVETMKMEETYEIQERLKSLYGGNIGNIIEKRNGNYRYARRSYGDRVIESKSGDFKEDIISCFYDLRDCGFGIECETHNNISYVSIYKFGIFSDPDMNDFNIDDVKETLLFAIPYIDETYKTSMCRVDVYCNIRFIDRSKTQQYWEWVSFGNLQEFFDRFDNINNINNIRRFVIQFKTGI